MRSGWFQILLGDIAVSWDPMCSFFWVLDSNVVRLGGQWVWRWWRLRMWWGRMPWTPPVVPSTFSISVHNVPTNRPLPIPSVSSPRSDTHLHWSNCLFVVRVLKITSDRLQEKFSKFVFYCDLYLWFEDVFLKYILYFHVFVKIGVFLFKTVTCPKQSSTTVCFTLNISWWREQLGDLLLLVWYLMFDEWFI